MWLTLRLNIRAKIAWVLAFQSADAAPPFRGRVLAVTVVLVVFGHGERADRVGPPRAERALAAPGRVACGADETVVVGRARYRRRLPIQEPFAQRPAVPVVAGQVQVTVRQQVRAGRLVCDRGLVPFAADSDAALVARARQAVRVRPRPLGRRDGPLVGARPHHQAAHHLVRGRSYAVVRRPGRHLLFPDGKPHAEQAARLPLLAVTVQPRRVVRRSRTERLELTGTERK